VRLITRRQIYGSEELMLNPRTPITVSMPAERWQQVLNVMAEAPLPYRLTEPLIREIQQQCIAAEPQPSTVRHDRANPVCGVSLNAP
jgi:hypothetical protein